MFGLADAILLLGVLAIASVLMLADRRRRARALRSGSFLQRPGIARRVEGTNVEFEMVDERRARLAVRGKFGDLELRPSNPAADDALRILTGDAPFDEKVVATGNVLTVSSALDEATRASVMGVVGLLGATVRGGVVSLLIEGAALEPGEMHRLTDAIARLARNLEISQREHVYDRLTRIAGADPIAGVRLHALEVLLERASDAEARPACTAAFVDADARVRFRGAYRMGLEGAPVLLALMEDTQIPVVLRVHSLERVCAVLPAGEAGELCVKRLTDGARPMRDAAVAALGRLRYRPACEALASMARRVAGVPSAAAGVAQALGQIGDPAGEAALLALLASDDRSVRKAAVDALALAGTAAAVEPLRAVTGELRGEAHAAAAQIQKRLPGAQPGQLTVAEPESAQGAVTLSEERGKVSLARKAEGSFKA